MTQIFPCAALTLVVALQRTAAADCVQFAGGNSQNVCGNNNITIKIVNNAITTQVINATPDHYVKQTDHVLDELRRHQRRRDRKDDERFAQIEATLAEIRHTQDVNAQTEAVRQLQTQVESIKPVADAVEARLQQTLELQGQVETLPEAQRMWAQKALDNADLEDVEGMLRDEQHVTTDYNYVGPVLGYMVGNGSTLHTSMVGFVGGGNIMASNLVSTPSVGLNLVYAGGEGLIGVTDHGAHDLYLAMTGMFGPRLRLGSSSEAAAFTIWLYWYCPFVEREIGRWRFPLVGVGASIGFQRPGFKLEVAYRYLSSRPLYADGFDSQAFVLLLSFHTESGYKD